MNIDFWNGFEKQARKRYTKKIGKIFGKAKRGPKTSIYKEKKLSNWRRKIVDHYLKG